MAHDDDYASRPDEEYTEDRRKSNVNLMLSLGRLEQGMKNVLSQLSEMNGTQKQLVERMGKVELFDELHPLKCPMKDQIIGLRDEFEKHVLANEVAKHTNKSWWEHLKPIILILAGGVLVLLARHLDQWWK